MKEKDKKRERDIQTYRDTLATTKREAYIKVRAVNKQVMQADAEAAVTCCCCYDDDRPIRGVVKQVSNSFGKHCRDASIYNSNTLYTH